MSEPNIKIPKADPAIVEGLNENMISPLKVLLTMAHLLEHFPEAMLTRDLSGNLLIVLEDGWRGWVDLASGYVTLWEKGVPLGTEIPGGQDHG